MAASQDCGGFGEWLEQVRTARGLTLGDISRETKIPLRNLEALEHGQLGVVPAFYQRAEVRAVARVVGVDEALAIGRLDTAIASAGQPHPREAAAEEASIPWSKPGSALAFVALTCGVLLAAAGIGRAVLGWVPPASALAGSSPAAHPRAADPVVDVDVAAAATAPATEVATVPEPAVPPADGQEIAPQTPVAPFTQFIVNTDPPGAQVTVNGISWGASPVTIRHLPPGAKRVRATKEGFAAVERVFALDDGQQRTVSLRLPRAQ